MDEKYKKQLWEYLKRWADKHPYSEVTIKIQEGTPVKILRGVEVIDMKARLQEGEG